MTIATTRRKLFGLIGAGTLAAKQAADDAIAKLAFEGRPLGLGGTQAIYADVSDGQKVSSINDAYSNAKRVIAGAEWIKQCGLPEILNEEIRRQTRYVYSIDVDIAVKKSWSLSVKVMTQRQRQYDRAIAQIQFDAERAYKRGIIHKFLGFDLPWGN